MIYNFFICLGLILLTSCYPPLPTHQLAEFESAHIEIIHQGSHLMAIIPTDYYFLHGTTEINPDWEAALIALVGYIHVFSDFYPDAIIYVDGHTNHVYTKKKREVMSELYADVIASYLWNDGIAQDRIQVRGFANQVPIGAIRPVSSNQFNRRVVILINPIMPDLWYNT